MRYVRGVIEAGRRRVAVWSHPIDATAHDVHEPRPVRRSAQGAIASTDGLADSSVQAVLDQVCRTCPAHPGTAAGELARLSVKRFMRRLHPRCPLLPAGCVQECYFAGRLCASIPRHGRRCRAGIGTPDPRSTGRDDIPSCLASTGRHQHGNGARPPRTTKPVPGRSRTEDTRRRRLGRTDRRRSTMPRCDRCPCGRPLQGHGLVVVLP